MPMPVQPAPGLPSRRAPRDSHPRSSARIRGRRFFGCLGAPSRDGISIRNAIPDGF
jgi:hypothetical protein